MSYEVSRHQPCKVCGLPTFRRERNTRDPLCVTCAIQKMTDFQIQMHNRSGPHYENWLAGMARKFNDQTRGRGTPADFPVNVNDGP
jgi:hypothetical protein